MGFGQIAKVYDRFNDLEVYEAWLDFTLEMYQGQPDRLLDLACGTGWFTQLIAPFVKGQVIGLDIDHEMLAIAQAEVLHTDQLQFMWGDMTALPAELGTFDLITCYADSLCFLDDMAQVTAVFKQAAQRLSEQGSLLFDVWTPYQVTEGFADFTYFDTDETGALMWDSEVEADKLMVTHYLTVFELDEQAAQRYQRLETKLEERTYPLEMYLQALKEAGFSNVAVYVNYGEKLYDATVDSQVDRWFFVCQK